jgi:Fur family ferric uptake transcriptional regulator
MKSEKITAILRRYNLKVTPVRIQVLSILLDSDSALSHSDITHVLSDEHFDKVTLYRTLNHFTEKGIVHKVATEDRNWLYAILTDNSIEFQPDHPHAHFVCDDCEKIYCFPVDEYTNKGVNAIKEGFVVKEQEIRLHGICPSCQ